MERCANSEKQTASGKKVYRSPELSLYGDVTQITRGGAGNGADTAPAGGGPMTKNCWIAEVLYGVDAPRTLLVRAWLSECYDRRVSWALVVVPMYRRFGRRVAKSVRSHAILQRLFRPLFDHAVTCANQHYTATLVVASHGA